MSKIAVAEAFKNAFALAESERVNVYIEPWQGVPPRGLAVVGINSFKFLEIGEIDHVGESDGQNRATSKEI